MIRLSPVLRRSVLCFFVIFLLTGTQNVVTQSFFLSRYPQQAGFLPPLCLLLGR